MSAGSTTAAVICRPVATAQATGGSAPLRWSATGLPPGMSLNYVNGTVLGAPTATGSFTTTLTAVGTGGTHLSTTVTWTVAAAATATSWYVDCSAASNGSGSPSAPWNNVASASAHVFAPGDKLLLKRGTTCAGQLAPKGDGTAAAPITVDCRTESWSVALPGVTAVSDDIFIGKTGSALPGGVTYRANTNTYFGFAAPTSDPKGSTADPLLVDATNGAPSGISALGGYRLRTGSPALGSGVPVAGDAGIDIWGDSAVIASVNRGAYTGPGSARPVGEGGRSGGV